LENDTEKDINVKPKIWILKIEIKRSNVVFIVTSRIRAMLR
jgi:hypothetical protein